MRACRHLVFSCVLFAAAHADNSAPCFGEDEQGTAACEQFLLSIEHDVAALQSLGRRLEIQGRYASAARSYRFALARHRNDRYLQQGLIRVRSELRARKLLAGFSDPRSHERKSVCWTARWGDAVAACAADIEQNAADWELQERYGDVLRSVGQPFAAITAYQLSLDLNSSNGRLRQKHATLLELVDLEGNDLPLEQFAGTYEPREAPIDEPEAAAPTASEVPQPVSLRGPVGRYRAIVIGNQDYENFHDLESPVADAVAIRDMLTSNYGFDVTVVTNATRYELFEELSGLRRQSGDYDYVMIYYAGHGYLDETTKRGYWLPVDAERNNPAHWISTADITNLVAGLNSRHALVVADSCFSGALARSALATSLDGRAALLERLSTRRSRTILTSGGLEPVLDSGNPGSRHSVFADALLASLRDNDGVVEAGRLFVDVRDRVVLASDQTPQYAPLRNAGHDGGDFIFVRQSNRSMNAGSPARYQR